MLNLIVETKNISSNVKVKSETQFRDEKMKEIYEELHPLKVKILWIFTCVFRNSLS